MQPMLAAQADLLLQTKYESWDQFAQPSLVRGGEGEDEMNKSRNKKSSGLCKNSDFEGTVTLPTSKRGPANAWLLFCVGAWVVVVLGGMRGRHTVRGSLGLGETHVRQG